LAALMARACRLTLSQGPTDPGLLIRVLRDLEQAADALKRRTDALEQPGPDLCSYELCELIFHVARLVDVLPRRPIRAVFPLRPVQMATPPDPLFAVLATLVAHLRDARRGGDGQIIIGCQPSPAQPSACKIVLGRLPVDQFVQVTVLDQAAGDLAEVLDAIAAAQVAASSGPGRETALAGTFRTVARAGGAVSVQCTRPGVAIFRIYWPTGLDRVHSVQRSPLLLTRRVA